MLGQIKDGGPNKGWSSSFGVERRAKTLHRTISCYVTFTETSESNGFFWKSYENFERHKNKGWSSSFGVERRAKTLHRTISRYVTFTETSEINGFFWKSYENFERRKNC